ncbi:MAG TPA: hypothetical protein VM434_09125 [Beijerinckiaceae bacterium]|nr:hypothetical protein [Beijerinckiaceae bacterium]
MKVILLSVAVVVGVGVIAGLLLPTTAQRPAYEAFTTTGARVGQPGQNLVGPRWDGQPRVQRNAS